MSPKRPSSSSSSSPRQSGRWISVSRAFGAAMAAKKRTQAARPPAPMTWAAARAASGAARTAAFGVEGRIGDDLIVAFALEARGAERLAGRGHVGVDDLESLGKAVPRGVLRSERAQPSVDLDRGHLDARDARQQAKPCDAHAGADIEHALARPRRHGGGEEHRIAAGPMSAARLHDADAAAEKIVGAGGARLAGARR